MTAPAPDNIVLIGYRGAGKSAVGRLLAEQVAWTFVDTDAVIEIETGRSIADIFAAEGEPAFRKREYDVIARITQQRHQIIAAGGGAILDQRNVDRLRASGLVIWLTAP
ncbi:MAG: shikimate kinase, partial [bacterium]|nr:shikimate kinase [bacterium]